MRIQKLTSALVIAMLTAATLHLSVKPAAADTGSYCAQLEQIRIYIESTWAPDFAKDLAIAAIYSSKRAAACIAE